MNSIYQAIIRTLCYADVFNFPLTQSEIHQRLIYPQKVSTVSVVNQLLKLNQQGIVDQKNTFYFLSGRESGVNTRLHRTKFSRNKQLQAKKIAKHLIRLPFVRAVFLTGAVAVGNATDEDDIDIMIITESDSLFTSRFFVNIWLELHQIRRHPDDTSATDKFCPNLFLTRNSLDVSVNQRSLYTAHEVCQTVPLADPDNIHQQFIKANNWTSQYLANFKLSGLTPRTTRISNHHLSPQPIESIMRAAQLLYMHRKQTREIVNKDAAYFHPRNTAGFVLGEYNKRVSQYL